MDTSLLHPGKRRSFPTAAAIIFILSSVVLVSCIIVRTSEDQVSILQEQQLKWEGRGESSARNEVEIFKKMGLIPKVKPYKWLGRGEKSAIKAIKDYHEAFPVPDYEWKGYASKSIVKEIHDSNVVHHIDSPYFEKQ